MSDGERNERSTPTTERVGELAGAVEVAADALVREVGPLLDGEGSDQTAADVKRAFEAAGDAAGAVKDGSKAFRSAQQAGSALRRGDAAGAVEGVLGATGGAAGHVGNALGSLGAATNDEGFRDAARVARAVQAVAGLATTVARHVGQVVRQEEQAAGAQSRHVEYELDIEGAESDWRVRSVAITEALSEPYEAVIRVRSRSVDVDVCTELLGRNASLIIDRRDAHRRRICGIIARVVEIGSRQHYTDVDLHVVPAFALLAYGSDSRIFQDKTPIEIVAEVLRLALRPYCREVDTSGLVATYAPREMCVQYRESHKDFVSRLLEEVGVGYYFEFDGDGHERMVLFDANEALAPLETMDGNAVPYANGARIVRESEPVVSFEPTHRLGATGVTVRDLDWTSASYRVESQQEGEDLRGLTRSDYDHGHGRSVTLHAFTAGGRYQRSDVEQQALTRRELLVRDGERWTGVSMVIGLRPGVTFELTGHPVAGVDGRYVVVKSRCSSAPPPHAGGEASNDGEDYHNVFECIREDVRYVPDRDTPKPAIYGVQTAVVSGPVPGEPYTDEYGRIRVRFHWDRAENDPSRASAWVRLGQTWAGHDGSGLHTFLFIPRVGSEVIVAFLDGDPDRPLVTGAVYNAQNLPPVALPDEATRSVIRTASVGGSGHNELSFEDAAGREEVYLRAQRNLREVVLHDHLTHVRNNHKNQVDGKDEEIIGGDQWLRVKGLERRKWVENNEINKIQADRETDVYGNDTLRVHSSAHTRVTHNMQLDVTGQYRVDISGGQDWNIAAGSTLVVSGGLRQTVRSGEWWTHAAGDSRHSTDQKFIIIAEKGVELTSHLGASFDIDDRLSVTARAVQITSTTKIQISAPTGITKVTPSNENNVADKLLEYVCDQISGGLFKLSAYHTAIGLHARKLEYSGLKLDLFTAKIGNAELKAELGKLELSNRAALSLRRAAMTLLG